MTYRALAEWLIVAVGLLVLLLYPHAIVGDGAERFKALSALLERGELSSARYSLIGPLFAAPLWLAGALAGHPGLLCRYYNFVVFALGLCALARLLGPRLGTPGTRRFMILLVFASMFAHHQTQFYGEVFTAMALAAATAAALFGRTLWPWLLLVLGVANAPATLPAAAVVSIERALSSKQARYGALFVACAFLCMAEAWLRRSSPWAFGYEGDHGFRTVMPYSGLPGFSYPFALGVLSLLVSFGKGLVFYAPGVFLSPGELPGTADGELRRVLRVWRLCVAALVATYASWWAWYGGWFFGPRFLLFASVPACFVLATRIEDGRGWRSDVLTLVAVGWSFWVGACGLVFGQANLQLCSADDYALEALCWYAPDFSALFRPFVAPKALSAPEVATLGLWLAVLVYVALPVLGRLRSHLQGAASLARLSALGRGWRI